MAKKVKNGYVAPKPANVTYTVNGTSPSGVFVQLVGFHAVEMHYAGTGVATADAFILPNDPKFLRDISRAINKVAKEIEDHQNGD